MRAPLQASPENIDISSVAGALKRKAPKILMWSAATSAATFLLLSMATPKFTSEAQLAITARSGANPFAEPGRDTSAEAVGVRMDKEAINTHVRALTAPELATAIAADMKLNTRPEFNSALPATSALGAMARMVGLSGPKAGESEEDRVLGAYFHRLEVYAAKESRSIGIRFTSADRELAAEIANRIADTYRANLANRSIGESDDVQKALVPKIEQLKAEVAEAEAQVERFRGAANIFKGGPQNTSLNEQQLSELTAAESKAKTEQGEAEARARSAREMMARGAADLSPDVQKSPLIQRLTQDRARLEREISELSATLLPGHPRMKQLASERAGLERQLQAEVRKVVDTLDKEAKVSAARVASIQKSLGEVKSRVVNTGTDQAKLTQLEATAKAKRIELDRLQSQYEANRARVEAKVVPVEAQIIAMARPANEPSSPRKVPMTLLVGLGTLLLGAGLTLTRELVSAARGGASGAAVAPRPGAPKAAPAAAFRAEPDGQGSFPGEVVHISSLNAVARHLMGRSPGGSAGVRTLVVGQTPGTDPAAEAIGLAGDLAKAGAKVVLIDWTAEGSGVATALRMPVSPGMAELMKGTAGFEQVIRRMPGSDAHVIPCGQALTRVVRALEADQINLLLDALDDVYEHIVVTGRHALARQLFETIEGRFDAGVLVVENGGPQPADADVPGTFLGFEVSDLEIVRFQRGGQPRSSGLPIRRARAG